VVLGQSFIEVLWVTPISCIVWMFDIHISFIYQQHYINLCNCQGC